MTHAHTAVALSSSSVGFFEVVATLNRPQDTNFMVAYISRSPILHDTVSSSRMHIFMGVGCVGKIGTLQAARMSKGPLKFGLIERG